MKDKKSRDEELECTQSELDNIKHTLKTLEEDKEVEAQTYLSKISTLQGKLNTQSEEIEKLQTRNKAHDTEANK